MLTDGVVTLRDISAADIALLYEWRNGAETRPMFRDDRPLELDSHSRFVRRHLEAPNGDYWWIIEVSRVPVGTISLYHFSADRRNCEFGRFIISPEHRGRGYGRRALALVMGMARSSGVERISCEVLSSNQGAVRLYDGLGFAAKGIDEAGPRSFILMEAGLNRK